MNYLFPLDTYFAAPLSEIFTDKIAMPVVNKVHNCVAFFFQPTISAESSVKWADRTIQYINFFGYREPAELRDLRNNPLSTNQDLLSATFRTISENTSLFASRTVIRGQMIKGAFTFAGYAVAPIFGDAAAETWDTRSKMIQTAHTVFSYGAWLLTLGVSKWM